MKTLSAAVLILCAAPVFAHEGMHGPGAEFDMNGDGVLSLDEYKAYLRKNLQDVSAAEKQFAALDTDKDGGLSSAEFLRGLTAGGKTSGDAKNK